VVLLNSVLLARSRVLVEFNIETSNLDEIVKGLPCMRAPTIAKLQMVDGYSIRIAIDKNDAFWLLPKLKHLGATDVILTGARQILK
jgi:ATP phosphoribosyltransferase-like protein